MYTKPSEVRYYLSTLENINLGGCGIAALTMWRWLKGQDLITENDKIVFLYGKDLKKIYANNVYAFNGGHNKPDSCDHVCLFYNGLYFDCFGFVKIDKYKWVQFVDENFLVESLNHGIWNSKFHRARAIDFISDELNDKNILQDIVRNLKNLIYL
jgi:hypothetical protein